MAETVDLVIGKRNYRLAVPDGQQNRLMSVASRVNDIMEEMMTTTPDMDRDRMLMLSALQLADELVSVENKTATEHTTLAAFHESLAKRMESLLPNA